MLDKCETVSRFKAFFHPFKFEAHIEVDPRFSRSNVNKPNYWREFSSSFPNRVSWYIWFSDVHVLSLVDQYNYLIIKYKSTLFNGSVVVIDY